MGGILEWVLFGGRGDVVADMVDFSKYRAGRAVFFHSRPKFCVPLSTNGAKCCIIGVESFALNE